MTLQRLGRFITAIKAKSQTAPMIADLQRVHKFMSKTCSCGQRFRSGFPNVRSTRWSAFPSAAYQTMQPLDLSAIIATWSTANSCDYSQVSVLLNLLAQSLTVLPLWSEPVSWRVSGVAVGTLYAHAVSFDGLIEFGIS